MSAVVELKQQPKLLARMAERFGVDPEKMMATLKATAFKGDVTNEQMMALLVVAEQYHLNPWTKEIYAFPDRSGIVPVVGVDGWCRIINEHPQCDGIEFIEDADGNWIDCKIYRKDRTHPTIAREWLKECKRDTQPWKSHPRRMLRHKALIQCARIVFGFVGIYDQDEAERIIDVTPSKAPDPRGDVPAADNPEVVKHYSAVVDLLNQDKDEFDIADDLRAYVAEHLQKFNELYIAVCDKLKKDGVISRANWDKYLKTYRVSEGREHGV